MNDATDDVLRGTAVTTAAKRHSVSRVTLLYKMTGKTPRKRQMGPQPVLTREEEDVLATWITTVAKAGYPITKTELLDSVQHIIKERNRKNPFVDNLPGRTWFLAFLKRHPNITIREESLSRWFEETDNYLKENKYENILEQSERVFNLDESAFFLNHKGNKVLCVKGEKNVYQQVNTDEKECLTVLVTENANGDLAPTLMVFKYERVPHELADSAPKHWGIGKSETGWMTVLLFFEFITHILYPFLV
ncbi:hypothetical protein PR048_019839 [Dryococelus australis]|uniref:HTH CENPB-type domain-containing protein n=1 Tax=Dryococelus australis TaxID=614101 RepID=A0ABQ9H4Y3_9NEOP|nr:hypothetical protein PR048_019839 [Dryococelus australis]